MSRQGDRLVTVRSYGQNAHLMLYKVSSLSSLPAYACNTGTEETLDSPTWSPDGRAIAFAHTEGVEVIPLPSVAQGCPGAGSGRVVIPGGSEPDWGPAPVNPGSRAVPTGPGDGPTRPGVGTPPQNPAETPATSRRCAAKATKKAKRRCLRAQALKKCRAKKTRAARTRCVRKVHRRFG